MITNTFLLIIIARVAVSPSTQFDSIISELNAKDQGRMQELLSMLQVVFIVYI
jgi:hypothetical protein